MMPWMHALFPWPLLRILFAVSRISSRSALSAFSIEVISVLVGVVPSRIFFDKATIPGEVFSEETLYKILQNRGEAILAMGDKDLGTMIAVAAGPDAIEHRVIVKGEITSAELAAVHKFDLWQPPLRKCIHSVF